MELRCPHKMHGILRDNGILEIRCGSRFCGAEPGIVVIHQFSSRTGELVATKLYKAIPSKPNEGQEVA